MMLMMLMMMIIAVVCACQLCKPPGERAHVDPVLAALLEVARVPLEVGLFALLDAVALRLLDAVLGERGALDVLRAQVIGHLLPQSPRLALLLFGHVAHLLADHRRALRTNQDALFTKQQI